METCPQLAGISTAVAEEDDIDVVGCAISWTPPWWPDGVPGPSVTLFETFASDVAKKNAEKVCKTALKNAKTLDFKPMRRQCFKCRKADPLRTHCSGNCP